MNDGCEHIDFRKLQIINKFIMLFQREIRIII